MCNAKVVLQGIRMLWEFCQTQASQNKSSKNNLSPCSLRRKKNPNNSLIRLLDLNYTISDLDVEVPLQKWAMGGKLPLGIHVPVLWAVRLSRVRGIPLLWNSHCTEGISSPLKSLCIISDLILPFSVLHLKALEGHPAFLSGYMQRRSAFSFSPTLKQMNSSAV